MRYKLIFLLAALLITIGIGSFDITAQESTGPSLYTSPHTRFGSVMAGHERNRIEQLEPERIHLGWQVEHGSYAFQQHNLPIDNSFVIHLAPYSFDYDSFVAPVTAAVRANPGASWAIGNEIDRPGEFQNAQEPEDYATIYHQLYNLIKSEDASAQLSIAGIVQPTPLRLRYLDMVWDAYLDQYGTTMPVDIWTIHNMILPESRAGFGAGIPPGIPDDTGVTYGVNDNDNINVFKQQIVDFRDWMAAKGERNKPLHITEYGVLMPAEFGFDTVRVKNFMYATFDYMLVAADDTTGYPADDNRLVQRWVWYSMDDYYYDQVDPGVGFNGNLFDALTREITPMGEAFAAYTMPDGAVTSLRFSPDIVVSEPVTISAEITNHGLSPAKAVTVTFWNGDPANGGRVIGTQQVAEIGSDYYIDQSQTVATTWTPPEQGFYNIFVTLTIADETEKSNNTISSLLSVVDHMIFLPLVTR